MRTQSLKSAQCNKKRRLSPIFHVPRGHSDLAQIYLNAAISMAATHSGVRQEYGLIYAHTYMRMELLMQATHSTRHRRTEPHGKRATNLSLSSDVLEAAKDLEINISQVCDNYLRELVRREQERQWREDHAEFIAAYNSTVESEGLPLDEWRSF